MKKLFTLALTLTALNLFAQDLQPTETDALLSVLVNDEAGKPLEGEPITFVGVKSKKTFSGTTKADGKFDILVPEGDKYKVKYKSFTEEEDFSELEIPSVPGLVNFEYTITVQLPKVYTLDNVFFDSGKSTLRAESFKELNELAEFMIHKKSMVIEIAGHTDNVGNPESNQKLSESRANEVRSYLIKKGVPGDRIQAKGYGDTQPVASNDTDAGKQKNRRTEVRIVTQ
jgi:outer membrane protein OmpA-like peptidoglycan-associated protein